MNNTSNSLPRSTSSTPPPVPAQGQTVESSRAQEAIDSRSAKPVVYYEVRLPSGHSTVSVYYNAKQIENRVQAMKFNEAVSKYGRP